MVSRLVSQDSRADISVKEEIYKEGEHEVAVRAIVSDGRRGLGYRAEIGGDPRDRGVIDAATEQELSELLPVAIRCYLAALRLRRRC